MDKKQSTDTVIGRAERVVFIDHGPFSVPAKVDTGADLSAVWASYIKETSKGLKFRLFDEGSEFYTGEVLTLGPDQYGVTRVANSFGEREVRYTVSLRLRLKGRLIKGTFTLANRKNKTYPVLLGRRLLAGKFLVDVKSGTPLSKIERLKKSRLAEELKEARGKS